MLTIRNQQMRVLSEAVQRQFEARLLAYWRESSPHRIEGLSADEAIALIHLGVEKAARYGILLETDVIRYIECMFVHGLDFDSSYQFEWAGKILNTPGINGTQKMNRILSHEPES